MNRGRLSRQSLPLFAASVLLLAAVIAAAIWFNNVQHQRRGEVENEALESARQVVALADAEVLANRRMLTLMAGSPGARAGDVDRSRQFFELSLAENPDWRGLLLRETDGTVLLERNGQPEAAPDTRPLRALPTDPKAHVGVEGVVREGRYCPCVVIHMPVVGWPDRVMTLFLSPDRFNQILATETEDGSLGGLGDRDGRFVGRTLDYAARVGTPGSNYFQRASREGGEGFYESISLEGRNLYTAHSTSPLTGWSAHVAVRAEAIQGFRQRSTMAVMAAIVASVLLAAGLILFAGTEMRRRAREQERLLEMQKAEAISRFTGTVVHDFRNILAVIDAGTRLILRESAGRGIESHAKAMQDAVERGNRLINQLLSFVRGETAEVGTIDLKKLITGADELIARSLGDGVTFSWNVAEAARYVRGNADQLELALLNLAINARDAMDGEGVFAIDAELRNDVVAIVASDTGPGVPAELRERIFEAFYSTKPEGKGTGLGLAQVAGAARQAGGQVVLDAAPSGGARIAILLPRAEAPAA